MEHTSIALSPCVVLVSLTFQRGQQHTVRQDSKSVLEGVQKTKQEEAESQGHS